MNNHKQACDLGEQALSDALEKIDDVDEETFRDAKSIIELLKENLSLWKEEEEQNAVEDLWAIRRKMCAVWLRMWPLLAVSVVFPLEVLSLSIVRTSTGELTARPAFAWAYLSFVSSNPT